MITLLIGLVCFSYLWAGKVEFIEDLKKLIGFGEDLKWRPKNKIIKYIVNFIHKQFNCYCIGFWITWIITGSLIYGLMVYVCVDILTNTMDLIKNNITY